MLDLIEKLQESLKSRKQVLLSANELPAGNPDLQITLSNTELLLDELLKFFKKNNSRFLPNTIIAQLSDFIGKANLGTPDICGCYY